VGQVECRGRIGNDTNLDLVIGAVEFGHALDLREGDGVTVFKSVPDLVKGGYKAALLLGDAGDHGRDWLLAIDITDDELVAEIIEDLAPRLKYFFLRHFRSGQIRVYPVPEPIL
jgi:hypothetical protein